MNVPTKHPKILAWVNEIAKLTEPDSIFWCRGGKTEYRAVMKIALESGVAISLKKSPNSFLFRSDASDVARVENRTYIASRSEEDAGPTNNWINPRKLKSAMTKLFKGCMKGLVLYVIPFSMGPLGSHIAKIGIQITRKFGEAVLKHG